MEDMMTNTGCQRIWIDHMSVQVVNRDGLASHLMPIDDATAVPLVP